MNRKSEIILYKMYKQCDHMTYSQEAYDLLFLSFFTPEERQDIILGHLRNHKDRLARQYENYEYEDQEELRRQYSIKIKNEFPIPHLPKRKVWVNKQITK